MLKVGFKKQNNNNKKNPNLKQKNKTYFPEINKVISFCLFTRCMRLFQDGGLTYVSQRCYFMIKVAFSYKQNNIPPETFVGY